LALALAGLDTLYVATAFLLAVYVTLSPEVSLWDALGAHGIYAAVFLAVWYTVAAEERLFTSRRQDALVPQVFCVGKGIVLTVLFSVFLLALFYQENFDREFTIAFAALGALIVFAGRTSMRLSLWGLRRRGYNFRRILVVGANRTTAHLVEVILSHEQFGFQIDGFLENDESRRPLLERYGITYLGPIDRLEQLLVDRVTDRVYVSLPVSSHYETIQNIAYLCEGVGVPVRLVANLFAQRSAATEITTLENIPLVNLTHLEAVLPRSVVRRVTDLVVSSLLLVLFMPAMAAIALMLKLESRRPVLEYTECVSRDQRRFKLVRFRCTAAHTDDPTGAPQVSRIGRFLLRHGLDELPQLFNVWRGQMSIMDPPAMAESDGGFGEADVPAAVEST
jgi:FlaA1/EpsC-like NDP-sugar epimerase